MKVLITSISAPTGEGQNGGAQVYILNLAIELVKMGHKVVIIGGVEPKLPQTENIKGVIIIRKGNRFFAFPSIYWYVLGCKKRTDVILENIMSYPYYLPLFLPFTKTKLVALKHHFLGTESRKVLSFPKHLVNRINENVLIPLVYSGNCFCVPSPRTASFLSRKRKKFNTIKILPPGFTFITTNIKKSKEPIILYVGTLNTNRKKIDDLILAFKTLYKHINTARLVIAGGGKDRRKLEEMGKGLPITFTGYITEQEKSELYDKAWFFVSPSLAEGFGITWIEANAHGLPVITYDIGLDTLSEKSAIFVPVGDVNGLFEAMLTLVSDAKLRNQFAKGAVENASRFSWGNTANEFTKWVA